MGRYSWLLRIPVTAAIAVVVTGCVVIDPHGTPPDHVTICHKGKKTLHIPQAAVQAHLGHGDTPGHCP